MIRVNDDSSENEASVQLEEMVQAFATLRRVKETFAARGWFPATSGNLSVRLNSFIAITSSGKDKEMHTTEDYLVVDAQANPVIRSRMKPSAETLVHAAIYRSIPECQAVFHIHTVSNNLISEIYRSEGKVTFSDHELLKALGFWEGGISVSVPIVDNHGEIPVLAAEVSKILNLQVPGVLIHNHGIYVWGNSDFAAKRHVEAFEFLFDYHLKSMFFEQLKTMKKGDT